MSYIPKQSEITNINLPEDILPLIELLAEHSHDTWARQRLKDGWRYGPKRDDEKKEHPSLMPYDKLPESEKEYDRKSAIETLKKIIALGYSLKKE
jgi:ryanodine receptor 2